MNSYDIKFRTKVVTYIKAGHTQAEAARKFGLNPHTVCNWIKLINENKWLRPILVPRGPHKLPREKLVEYVKEHPDALLENIATHFKCARSTIHKTLRNLGIRRKKKTKLYRERDETARQKFKEEISNIPKERLVYTDETGIESFLYNEYGWSKRGEKIMGEISGKKFERRSIVAGKCGDRILAPFGYNGTCDAILFNFWLENKLLPLLKPGQIIIMDNASIHKSSETERLINSVGCSLRYLPSYSPDLNPIEHLWANIKKKLKLVINHFSSLDNALIMLFS